MTAHEENRTSVPNDRFGTMLAAVLVSVLALVVTVAGTGVAQAQPVPGAVLAVAPLDNRLSVPGAASAHALTYATEWRSGEPTTATGVLFVPQGDPPAGGWPVVAWAHGTVGLADDCAPSRNPRTERDTDYLDHWLGQGYAVVAADYPGLGVGDRKSVV